MMKHCKYIMLLLSVFVYNIQAQSWFKVPGSNDLYTFVGGTTDYIFIKGEPHIMSESPLSVFKDYESIYDTSNVLKYSISYSIPISLDKYYDIYWAIGPDSMLYLCQTSIWDEGDFNQKVWMNFSAYVDLITGINMPGNTFLLYLINPSKYMRHIPVEQLTGGKFRQSPFFRKIIDIPLNDNGVLPAIWYSDTLYVKPRENAFEDQDGPYDQLIIRNGRVTKVNKIVPIIRPWPKRRER